MVNTLKPNEFNILHLFPQIQILKMCQIRSFHLLSNVPSHLYGALAEIHLSSGRSNMVNLIFQSLKRLNLFHFSQSSLGLLYFLMSRCTAMELTHIGLMNVGHLCFLLSHCYNVFKGSIICQDQTLKGFCFFLTAKVKV